MTQSVRGIVTELHDEPHLEGRRVTVRRVQSLVEKAGKPAPEVAEDLNLNVADVYAALQYYHSHPEEIQEAERKQHQREADAKQSGAVTLTELKEQQDPN